MASETWETKSVSEAIETGRLNDRLSDVYEHDTLLCWCVRQHDNYNAKRLIDAGADVNAGDGAGWTPLMFAAFYNNLDMVRTLLEANADMTIVVNEDESVFRCSKDSCQAIKDMLQMAAITGEIKLCTSALRAATGSMRSMWLQRLWSAQCALGEMGGIDMPEEEKRETFD